MSYINININFNEGTLCEEISFSVPGAQSYTLGSTITLSDPRLWRDRQLIVRNVNYQENENGGLSTTVSGFSLEYRYSRRAADTDIAFYTMTTNEYEKYNKENPSRQYPVYILYGDEYGVGGWSMHSIVEKIAGWMGLPVVNTLPDFHIGDFSISLGSTFFEALTGLVSAFEPIIVLSYGTLYILARNGAGILASNPLTLDGVSSISIDKEYTPRPGCIRVEGTEGRYLDYKDPDYNPNAVVTMGQSYTATSSGMVTAPDGSSEVYSITEKYLGITTEETVLVNRDQLSVLTTVDGHVSHTEIAATISYSFQNLIEEETETCKAMVGENFIVYSKINSVYEHDQALNLKGQITSKTELFILDSDDGSYTKYDPRDYSLSHLEDYESPELIVSEVRTTRYSRIHSMAYGVDTIIASKMWNVNEGIWQTFYTFEHDIVEARGQQQYIDTGGTKTLQVYAGDCPTTSLLSIKSEPAVTYSFPCPDWNTIQSCYNYLSALHGYEFQTVQATAPIIDPLPLMAIKGLGTIAQSGIIGYNYVIGYSINIDSSGHTINLDLEARCA